MSIRKHKRRIDARNWKLYITPRIIDGLTFICNQRQFVTAYGKPQRRVINDLAETTSETLLDVMRVTAHIEDTGEVEEFVMKSPKVFCKEVDHCTVIPNFHPADVEAMKNMAKLVAESENPAVHIESKHLGAFKDISAEEVKQAAQNFLDMQANQPVAPFVTLKDFEVVDGNTLKANLVLRPGNDEERAIAEQIKCGNSPAFSMSAKWEPGDPRQMFDRVIPRQNIPDMSKSEDGHAEKYSE